MGVQNGWTQQFCRRASERIALTLNFPHHTSLRRHDPFFHTEQGQSDAHLEAKACQGKAWRGDNLKAAVMPHQISHQVPQSDVMPAEGLDTLGMCSHGLPSDMYGSTLNWYPSGRCKA